MELQLGGGRKDFTMKGGRNSVFIQESFSLQHICAGRNWPRLVDQSEPLRTSPAAAGTCGQLRTPRCTRPAGAAGEAELSDVPPRRIPDFEGQF